MALLRVIEDERLMHLPLTVLVGRGEQCDLMVPDVRVSGAHLRVSWLNNRWTVRDLGSRNGTWLSGVQLQPGDDVNWPLDEVIRLAANGPQLALIDDSPPPAHVTEIRTGTKVYADCGILAFPDPEAPRVTVYRQEDGWIAEVDTVTLTVQDGQILSVDEAQWRLTLTPGIDRTQEALAARPNVDQCALRFEVSLNEERVRLWLKQDGQERMLPERRFHYLLLTLARQRQSDAREGHGKDAGWIDREQLYRMLRTDRESFNRDVFRARKQLAAAGLNDPAKLVEVWGDSRRLGIANVKIQTL